jgi:hypothetical protein
MSVAELAYTGFGTPLLRLNKTLQSLCIHDVYNMFVANKKENKNRAFVGLMTDC